MDYADELLREIREELTRADAKAATLLAGFGVAAGALLAGLLANTWSPNQLDNRIEWLWWVGIAIGLTSLVLFAFAVYPRTKRSGNARMHPPMYYGDVVGLTPKELSEALRADPSARRVDQIIEVSTIVSTKYGLLRAGMSAMGAAAALCLASVVTNLLLQ